MYTCPIFNEGGHGFCLHRNSKKCQLEGCMWQCSFSVAIAPLCICKSASQKFPGKKEILFVIADVDVGQMTRRWQEDRLKNCLQFSDQFHRSVKQQRLSAILTQSTAVWYHQRREWRKEVQYGYHTVLPDWAQICDGTTTRSGCYCWSNYQK